jgi:putative FmdB family regulatory protein
MPIFEYTCKHCKMPFEALVMGGRKASCPHCGSGDLEDKFSTYSVGAGRGWRGAQWQGGSACGASGGT